MAINSFFHLLTQLMLNDQFILHTVTTSSFKAKQKGLNPNPTKDWVRGEGGL